MKKIKKKDQITKENIISLTITAFSIVIILLLQLLGIFYTLELKALDYAFGIRGPTTGVLGHFNEKADSTDIVLVDLVWLVVKAWKHCDELAVIL